MSDHALLSPSSAHRWLICNPSMRLEQEFPNVSSSYADEGTLAHDLAKIELWHRLEMIDEKEYQQYRFHLRSNDMYNKEMQYHVDNYVEYCLVLLSQARAKGRKATAMIEERVELNHFAPESFGTSDFNISGDNGLLTIVDFKYGQGVPVSAVNNVQGMMYALGVLYIAELLYPIKKVRIIVDQPRLDNRSEWTLTADELKRWGEEVLIPNAARAWEGEGDYKPGDHCKFCRAKATCKALKTFNLELARHEFQLPDLMSDEEVAEVLSKADLFINWINAVKAHALDQAANHGKSWPGYKVVKGRSNRKITDTEKATRYLLKMGYDPKEIIVSELKGLGEIQKVLSRAEYLSFEQRFIVKPEGAPTLVPVTDKRPAINSLEDALNDFKHLLD